MINKAKKNTRRHVKLSRRDMLRGALAGTAVIPLLDADESKAQDAPVRFVAFETANGTRNSLFWPTGSPGALSFPQLTAPLEPIQDKLLFLKGIRHCPAVVGDNGFNGGLNGSEHARGIGGFLTARPLGTGNFSSFMATSGWGTGISIDQHLAQVLDTPTTFKSLEVGVQVRDAQVRGRISYTGKDSPVPPREDPADVFEALFGSAATNPADTQMGMTVDQLRAERRSVFDFSKNEIQRLQSRLGQDDRDKLEAHLTAVRSIEERLAGVADGQTATSMTDLAGCAAPNEDMNVDITDDATMPDTGRLQMDLVAVALACDATRIVTLQWAYAESEHLYPWLGLSRNHHAISHDWQGTTGFEEYGQIHVWLAEQFKYFLDTMDSYQEGDRTLLDNSVVFWGSEIGESTQHDLTLMPYVLAGSAGGQLNTGRVVDYTSAPRDNNQLLVSIANVMGDTELTQFGDETGATGNLPDLWA